jgi:hypothetical protein
MENVERSTDFEIEGQLQPGPPAHARHRPGQADVRRRSTHNRRTPCAALGTQFTGPDHCMHQEDAGVSSNTNRSSSTCRVSSHSCGASRPVLGAYIRQQAAAVWPCGRRAAPRAHLLSSADVHPVRDSVSRTAQNGPDPGAEQSPPGAAWRGGRGIRVVRGRVPPVPAAARPRDGRSPASQHCPSLRGSRRRCSLQVGPARPNLPRTAPVPDRAERMTRMCDLEGSRGGVEFSCATRNGPAPPGQTQRCPVTGTGRTAAARPQNVDLF